MAQQLPNFFQMESGGYNDSGLDFKLRQLPDLVLQPVQQDWPNLHLKGLHKCFGDRADLKFVTFRKDDDLPGLFSDRLA